METATQPRETSACTIIPIYQCITYCRSHCWHKSQHLSNTRVANLWLNNAPQIIQPFLFSFHLAHEVWSHYIHLNNISTENDAQQHSQHCTFPFSAWNKRTSFQKPSLDTGLAVPFENTFSFSLHLSKCLQPLQKSMCNYAITVTQCSYNALAHTQRGFAFHC